MEKSESQEDNIVTKVDEKMPRRKRKVKSPKITDQKQLNLKEFLDEQ